MKIQKIVVGIDFSPYSELARLRAYELAAGSNAEVILVHAYEDSDYEGQETYLLRGDTFNNLLKEGRRSTELRMQKLVDENKPAGLKVSYELSESTPDVALIDAVERHDADLVALGTHGHTGFDRLMLARIAERVVRKSPCSVLVTRASKTELPTMSEILVPTDFSKSADAALSAACDLVSKEGTIDVLHCWRSPFYATSYRGLAEERFSLEPELEGEANKRGTALLDRFRDRHSKITFEEKHENAAPGIHAALEEKAYDLVVMGSHGRHGVERFLLGSVAEATVRHANCSVLVLRERSE
jgi:nucleotide-binding universal stress UspA family protein